MSISMIFYCISVLENLSFVLCFFIFLMVIVSVIFSIIYAAKYDSNYDDSFKKFHNFIVKYIKKYIAVFISTCLIVCLIPSSLTMYSMVGIEYLDKSKIPEKVVKLVNLKLDEYIEKTVKPQESKQ